MSCSEEEARESTKELTRDNEPLALSQIKCGVPPRENTKEPLQTDPLVYLFKTDSFEGGFSCFASFFVFYM